MKDLALDTAHAAATISRQPIHASRSPQGRIAVVPGSSIEPVLLFDAGGKFLTPIGRKGSGPNEYVRTVAAHWLDADRLNAFGISALDVRDYGRAEGLVKDLKKVANDFDDSKPTQAIEAARIQSRMLLAKARDALSRDDKVTMEKALVDAAEVWPNNPEFKEATEKIFKQTDVLQDALREFDSLVGKRDYRGIWNDKVRFIAAVAVNPERKQTLEKVMKNIETIEASLMRAEEMSRTGNQAGAWESLERAYGDFPDDGKLNQQRADMTTRASDFVKMIHTAEELEKREQVGSSLAHFLKAQKMYPASDFARDGVARLVKLVLPEE
jgi:hypothetical protein